MQRHATVTRVCARGARRRQGEQLTGRNVRRPATCMNTSFQIRDLNAERWTVSWSAIKLKAITKAIPTIESAMAGTKAAAWLAANAAAQTA
jgi:hypothetical protein